MLNQKLIRFFSCILLLSSVVEDSWSVKFSGNDIEEEEETTKEKIQPKKIDEDMRYQIKKTDEWPYCLFGLLSCNGEGSGTLVGPNLVLTAAHNIYSHKTKKEVPLNSVFFYPGKNGNKEPYGKIGVTSFYYPDEYKDSEESPNAHDWAILVLEKNIGNKIGRQKKKPGWFKLKALNDKESQEYPICITGYPEKKVHHGLYEAKGSSKEIKTDIIRYILDTAPGQSGCGVWTTIEGENYLIGVHQGGKENDMNWATRWTDKKHKIFSDFRKKYPFDDKNFDMIEEVKEQLDNQNGTINLSSQYLEENEIKKIVGLLKDEKSKDRVKKVKEIDFSNNNLTSKSLTYLKDLTELSSLEILRLRNVGLPVETLIEDLEKLNMSNIKGIDLEENEIASEQESSESVKQKGILEGAASYFKNSMLIKLQRHNYLKKGKFSQFYNIFKESYEIYKHQMSGIYLAEQLVSYAEEFGKAGINGIKDSQEAVIEAVKLCKDLADVGNVEAQYKFASWCHWPNKYCKPVDLLENGYVALNLCQSGDFSNEKRFSQMDHIFKNYYKKAAEKKGDKKDDMNTILYRKQAANKLGDLYWTKELNLIPYDQLKTTLYYYELAQKYGSKSVEERIISLQQAIKNKENNEN